MIIESQGNTEETEDVVETQEEETTETSEESANEGKETKQGEAPEARKARLERQLEQLKKKHPELYPNQTSQRSERKQSDDFGYDVKAFLTANGIKGAKEFDFFKTEMKKSGQDVESLLENEYFIQRLNSFRELNKTSEATIKGSRSNSVPTDSVEYWASKPIEEVPQAMRIKVVNHKLKQNESKGTFYNS